MVRNAPTERAFTEADYTDFAHTGPGTLAGRYLRMFWQPVSLSRDLSAGRAKPIRIMCEDFTLYRGESGTPHVVAFRCAHRGTQLSTGWVEGDELRCFYHGWQYDGAGQCTEQPAEPEPFCNRIKIKSYPVEEYLGFIFAFLGEGKAPSFPRWPEFESKGVHNDSRRRSWNYFQAVENAIDEVHINFTHRDSGFAAAGLTRDIPIISAEETDYGLIQYGTHGDGVTRVTYLLMPNAFADRGAPDPVNGRRDNVVWRVPVDDQSHLTFDWRIADVTGEQARRYEETMLERAHDREANAPRDQELSERILAGQAEMPPYDPERPNELIDLQDIITQEGQGRIQDRSTDHLGRSDQGVFLLRRLWARELEALATGRPMTQWSRPRELATHFGV